MIRSKNEYQSSKKSKELIKYTLLNMIKGRFQSKPITITELVEKAGINRGTFYFHYKNIYEVIKEIEQDVTNEFKTILTKNAKEIKTGQNVSTLINCLSKFMKDNNEIFSYFLTSDEYKYFVDKIKTEIIKFVLDTFFKTTDYETYVSINFYINGLLGLYEDYYNHRIKITYEKLNDALIVLLNRSFEQTKSNLY